MRTSLLEDVHGLADSPLFQHFCGLAELRPDSSQKQVVLVDLNLPDVHGFEVLKWIRSQPEYARMPVVIFSSSRREEDRLKAREFGANHFLEKPTSGLKFGAVVEELKDHWLAGKERKRT